MRVFQEATPEERKRFYEEEWSADKIPDYLVDSIPKREFGFDHDGSGPKDRYRAFGGKEDLEGFIKTRAPYAAYSSVCYYKNPSRREGDRDEKKRITAELVFDIDAKDLPVKNCCPKGEVCTTCLERAKQYAKTITGILEEDLGIGKIHYVYSGRGYHIRIFDGEAMHFEDPERGYVLDYLCASEVLQGKSRIDWWLLPEKGYTRIFRNSLLDVFQNASMDNLREIANIGATKAQRIIDSREAILEDIRGWNVSPLKQPERGEAIKLCTFPSLKIISEKDWKNIITQVARWNASILDAKVTVDVKRILRLPSSLHSKVSMVCTPIKDIGSFDPLREAVPKFVEERES